MRRHEFRGQRSANRAGRTGRINPGAQFRVGPRDFVPPPVIACEVHGRIHWPLARPFCPACGRPIQAFANEVEMALAFGGLPDDFLGKTLF